MKGFTLIETLVVISILAIFVAVGFGITSGGITFISTPQKAANFCRDKQGVQQIDVEYSIIICKDGSVYNSTLNLESPK